MDEKELKRKIYKIINEEVYSEGKTFYPTKKDLERNPNMHPGFEHVVSGQRTAARKIVEFLKNEVGIILE
jgi:hypothetical protein